MSRALECSLPKSTLHSFFFYILSATQTQSDNRIELTLPTITTRNLRPKDVFAKLLPARKAEVTVSTVIFWRTSGAMKIKAFLRNANESQ